MLGIVLLFAIVLLVSGSVVLVGTASLEDARSSAMDQSAVNSMTDLQSAVDQLETESGSQTVSFADSPSDGSPLVESASGSEVTAEERTWSVSIDVTDGDGDTETRSRELGAVAYESDSGRLLYQGGGVFRLSEGDSGSSVVSPPDIQYQYRDGSPTLRMALTNVTVEGARAHGSFSDDMVLRQTNRSRMNASESPLASGESVNITVESDAYRAWAGLFRDRVDEDNVTVGDFDGDGQMAARVSLSGAERTGGPASPSPPSPPSPSAVAPGALVTTEVDELVYGNHANVDSYDSSNQPVGPSPGGGTDTTVYVNGSYDPQNHVYIDGDLVVTDRAVFDATDNAGPRHHVEGDTIIGGVPGSGGETIVDGNTQFKGVFSTQDDLSVEGKNDNDGKRALFEDDVYVGGDVTQFEDVTVDGNLYVQGDVHLDDGADIQGDIIAGGTVHEPGDGATVSYSSKSENADPAAPLEPDLPGLGSVADDITEAESELSGDNDNPGDGTIDDIESSSKDCEPCTLAGSADTSEYYIENGIDIENHERLEFDTTSGPITVYTNGVSLDRGRIEVHGDDPVRIYNGGDVEITGNSGGVMTYDASGSTRTYRAPNFRVFMLPDATATLGDPVFTGVVHGPGGTEIDLNNDAEIYGAVIGNVTDVNNHAEIHFDEALLESPSSDDADDSDDDADDDADDSDDDDAPSGPSNHPGYVSYLTVTTEEVTVDED